MIACGTLTEVLLQVAPHEEVELLLGPADLDVRPKATESYPWAKG